jgi:Flp pilus assembly protein TadD
MLVALFCAILAMFAGSFAYRMQSRGLTVEMQQEKAGGKAGNPMGAMFGMDVDQLRELMRRVQENPKDPHALTDMANAFMMMQAWDKALEYLTNAQKYAPGDMKVQQALGMVHFQRKEYDQAKKSFDAVLKKDPDDTLAHYNLGILLKHYMNRASEGDQHFRRVVQIGTADADVLKSAQEELAAQAPK